MKELNLITIAKHSSNRATTLCYQSTFLLLKSFKFLDRTVNISSILIFSLGRPRLKYSDL